MEEPEAVQQPLWEEEQPVTKRRATLIWIRPGHTKPCDICGVIIPAEEERYKVVYTGGGGGTGSDGHGNGKYCHLECGIPLVLDSWRDVLDDRT